MGRIRRVVAHEVRPLTDAERVRYAYTGRSCSRSCRGLLAVACVHSYSWTSCSGYKSSGELITLPRCATHGARWAKRHGLAIRKAAN